MWPRTAPPAGARQGRAGPCAYGACFQEAAEGFGLAPSVTRAAPPLMILPQVHLRKPCYDFYFL